MDSTSVCRFSTGPETQAEAKASVYVVVAAYFGCGCPHFSFDIKVAVASEIDIARKHFHSHLLALVTARCANIVSKRPWLTELLYRASRLQVGDK